MLSPAEFVNFYAQVGEKKCANSAQKLYLSALLAGFYIASGAVVANTAAHMLANAGMSRVVCGLLFFGYSSLLTFLTPYANEIGLGRAASVFFVAYALAMFITRPFTGRAFDRVGPHPVMIPAFFSFAAGLGVANATFYMLLDVGVGIGPVLLGVLVPLIGYSALYLCMAAVGLVAFALFLVVAKTEKGAR